MTSPTQGDLLMSESQLMNAVLKLANTYGYVHYHTHRSDRSDPGFPDLVLVNPDRKRVIYAELKKEKGKLSEYQSQWLMMLKNCGQECYVWRPSNLESIPGILKAIKEE